MPPPKPPAPPGCPPAPVPPDAPRVAARAVSRFRVAVRGGAGPRWCAVRGRAGRAARSLVPPRRRPGRSRRRGRPDRPAAARRAPHRLTFTAEPRAAGPALPAAREPAPAASATGPAHAAARRRTGGRVGPAHAAARTGRHRPGVRRRTRDRATTAAATDTASSRARGPERKTSKPVIASAVTVATVGHSQGFQPEARQQQHDRPHAGDTEGERQHPHPAPVGPEGAQQHDAAAPAQRRDARGERGRVIRVHGALGHAERQVVQRRPAAPTAPVRHVRDRWGAPCRTAPGRRRARCPRRGAARRSGRRERH